MGRSKDIASGSKFVDTAGDTMTGTLNTTGLNVTQTGSTTVKVGATGTSGDNDGTLIVNNGGSGDGMLRFDYETNTDRARIGVTTSGQDLKFFTAGNNERVKIDSSGHVTMPNQPVFYGTRATNQSTTGNQDASTPIDFPTSNTIISSTHWNHSNHRFTAPVTGNYMFEWGYATNQIAGQSVYRTFLWKNGSKQAWTQLRNDSNGHTGYNYSSRGALLPLTANDYIHLNSSTDAGYAFYGDSTLRIHLSIFLVG